MSPSVVGAMQLAHDSHFSFDGYTVKSTVIGRLSLLKLVKVSDRTIIDCEVEYRSLVYN